MAQDRKEVQSGDAWRPLRIEGLERPTLKLPTTPFARLGLAHAVCSAGDTFVTIGLAKSLFFVNPSEARSKVLAYLVMTLLPFALVSPFIGPLVDRYAGNKRWLLVGSAAVRAVLCLLMSQDVNGALLFPEAFILLAVSKGYSIARSSLVPSIVPNPEELVRANSRLALLSAIAGFLAAIPAGLLSLVGARWVLTCGALTFGVGAYFASRIVLVVEPKSGEQVDGNGGSMPSEGPEVVSKDLARRRRVELRLATLGMSVLRGLVGFVTFLLAFTLKREAANTAWLGVMGAAGIGGSMLGSVIAPRLRKMLEELHILWASLILVASICALGIFESEPLPSALVVLAVSIGSAGARLAFDALMQRDSAESIRGSAFARLETRFQLAWVLGALIPVAARISRQIGFSIMALVSIATIAILVGGEASLKRIDAAIDAGTSVWRRPARMTDDEWRTGDEPLDQ
jgi:Major Facilitator Superfamily